MTDFSYSLICCPKCRGELKVNKDTVFCSSCKQEYQIIDGNIISIIPDRSDHLDISINKWDKIYRDQLKTKEYLKNFEEYERDYYVDVFNHFKAARKLTREDAYLEIGCGPFYMGQLLANKVKLVVGIDFCPSALKIAKKMLEKKGIKNYLLIQGDILKLPLKDSTIDFIYGGGVIEHFDDTQGCLEELYRVLKPEGASFNSVPYLNIGALTYRQVWGNIPNMPVLKQIAEFVHIKLLRKKFMKFGYEMSFLQSTLLDLHKKAGFNRIIIDKFGVKLSFDFLPNILKRPLIWLANNSRLFWPMVKAIGIKNKQK